MNCCLQKYTTHQFTYFIYYLFQDNFKNAKIIKNQEVHQTIHANFKTISKMQKLSKTKKYIKRYMQTIPFILFKLLSIGDSFEFSAT